MSETFAKSLMEESARLGAMLPRLAAALVVVTLFLLFGRMVARAAHGLLARRGMAVVHAGFIAAAIRWGLGLTGLSVALGMLGLQSLAASLVASGGLAAVVLGFAFREIGENLLAGLFLSVSRPFRDGDLIRSGEIEGRVRRLDLRTTHVRTDDGRDVFIPNAQIFNSPLTNFTLDGLRRLSFRVGIEYGEDLGRVRALIGAEIAQHEAVLPDPDPLVTIQELADAWVVMSAAFWIDTEQLPPAIRGSVRTEVIAAVQALLEREGIKLSASATTNLHLAASQPLRIATE